MDVRSPSNTTGHLPSFYATGPDGISSQIVVGCIWTGFATREPLLTSLVNRNTLVNALGQGSRPLSETGILRTDNRPGFVS